MAKLVITRDGLTLKEYVLDKERTIIGRDPSSDIHLDDETVSAEHGAVIIQGGIFVMDLGSTNGVLVNGRKISKAKVQHGDTIRVGRHEMKLIEKNIQDLASTMVLESE